MIARNKILITIMALAVALAALLTQESLAFFTTGGEATNVITSGDISCQIMEKMGDKDFPKEGVYIMPGSIISKKVTVRNTGGHPCWLRMKVTNGLDDKTLDPNIAELDFNDQDWLWNENGFYYYNRILEAGKETEPLFTQVKISGSADNRYIGKTLSIKVTAYAVQSEHNDPPSPFDVSGWPAE